MTPLEWVHLPNNDSEPACEAMACKNRVFVSTRVEAAKLLPSSVAPATELLDTTTAGPRTVPVRSPLAGVKTLEFSRPPRPRDVLRAGTARAPVAVSRCARRRRRC